MRVVGRAQLFLSDMTLYATHQPKQEQASKIEKP